MFSKLLYMGAYDVASSFAALMTWLHQEVFFYLVIICIFVLVLMVELLADFWFRFNHPSSKEDCAFRGVILDGIHGVHNNILEVFWTILPSLVLLLIALPSLDLLYIYDHSIGWNLCLKATGHQWYWTYEITGLLRFK